MALFKRRSADDSDVPEDLQQYYASSGHSSSLLKWVIRIVVLVIALALLIWGIIWAVHALTHKNGSTASKSTSTHQQATNNKKTSGNGQKATPAPAQSQTPTPAPAPAPSPSTAQTGADAATQGITGTSGNSSNGTSKPLASTGPETAQFAWLFAGATILGTAFHAAVLRRKTI